MRLRIHFPDNNRHKEVQLNKRRVRIGRDAGNELAVDAKRFPKVSGLHAELILKDGKVWLIHRSKSNSTVLNDEAIKKPTSLSVGQRFRLGFTGPEIELVSEERVVVEKTIFAGRASDHVSSAQLSGQVFEVGKGGIIGRSNNPQGYRLVHPHVSRRHARLMVAGDRTAITDLGSSNGTYVNGQRIDKTTELQPGAVIDIGPFSLDFDGVRLTSRSRANNVRLDVNQVSYVVADQNTNRQLHLLNDVTFHISPGQFVAILGPSGSGKSTLLKVASGREWPFAGSVALNDRDLHRQFAALKEDLVVVPQTAAFHQTLSVQQTVQFAASLRLPPDTDDTEIQSIVAATLQRVGLSDRNASKVDALSGGQLKRLGLACELISDPSLLFLDEVTSGLDEQGDREMMRLFRQLADSGKDSDLRHS